MANKQLEDWRNTLTQAFELHRPAGHFSFNTDWEPKGHGGVKIAPDVGEIQLWKKTGPAKWVGQTVYVGKFASASELTQAVKAMFSAKDWPETHEGE